MDKLNAKGSDLLYEDFRKKYPERTFYHDKIEKYCMSIFEKNDCCFSCEKCVLSSYISDGCCHSLDMPLEELKLRYEKILEVKKSTMIK
jgi:hypothetical protein